MDYLEDFELIRPRLADATLADVIAGRIDPDVIPLISTVFDLIRARERLPLDIFILQDALSNSELLWGVSSQTLLEWGCQHFGEDHHLQYLVTSFALALFPNSGGIWIGPGEVNRRCKGLPYDDDGLLDIRFAQALPTRSGILLGPHLLCFHPWLRRYNLGLTGGFFDWLFRVARPSITTAFLGLRKIPTLSWKGIIIRRSTHEIICADQRDSRRNN